MAEEPPTINLKVLSPSTEVEGGIHLPDLPAATTVRELRQRIHDAAPSRPAIDRMRLIYRGRVVANDSDTLQQVFGIDNIRESKDQSLHLVLRELPSAASAPSPAPRSSTAPPNPSQPGLPQSSLQANPFRTIPEPRPNSQPPAPQAHHHHHPHHHHHHHPPLNPLGPRPVPLPPHLQFAQAILNPPLAHPPQQPGTPAQEGGVPGQQGPQRVPLGLPNLPGGHTRTVRQEAVGPNGERWTVTWNNMTNIAVNPNQQHPILPRPFPHPANMPADDQLHARLAALRPQNGPGSGPAALRTSSPAPGNEDQTLQRMRTTMEHARQEMENVRVLLQPPAGQAASVSALAAANPPSWRVNQIRLTVRNLIMGLDIMDRGLASLATNPLMAQNRDFVALQEAALDMRRQAEEFNRLLDRIPQSETSGSIPSIIPSASTLMQTQQSSQSPSSNVPTELFILSSPQGPVGILFDQQGTYSTGPPTMPFQTFSQQFNSNRLQLGHVGRQIGLQNSIPRLPAHVLQPTATQPTQGLQPAQDANQAQAPNANADVNANANPVQPQAAPVEPAPQVNRVDNIAGHIWLIFKLAVFVYFFAGGGGWYRPLMICIIAGIVYLAQVGIFEEHFTAVRQYLESLLPPGALGLPDRAGNNAAAVDTRPAGAGAQRAQIGRNPTPEETARRLQQQHRDQRVGWVRESLRTAERAFAIFVASLWPGIGERMVQAQEERVRAERVAEEERQEEEARRREEEQKNSEKQAEAIKHGEGSGTAKSEDVQGTENEPGAEASSSKGKGKAARVEDADADVD